MEITAVAEALEALKGPGARHERLDLRGELLPRPVVGGVARRGWRNSGRQAGRQPRPVGAAARAGARSEPAVRFAWVKGHSGDAMNDRVDLLAMEAAATQRRESGDVFPD